MAFLLLLCTELNIVIDSDEVSADSDPDDSGVDTEADPEYLHALERSLDKCTQVRGRGTRLNERDKRKGDCDQLYLKLVHIVPVRLFF